MKVKQMKLSDLIKPERNVRLHTEKQLHEFERSINMFGQIRPIVIDENNVILAGNGLYDTLIRMGKDTADVYQYSDLTENQKKKLMIADNKIFNLGIENLGTLNELLDELCDDLDIPGFDEEILQQMVADAEEVTEKVSEYGTLDEDEIESIKNYKMQQSVSVAPVKQQTEEKLKQEQGEDSAEVKKFVLCPKCGEKIWL